MRIFTYHVNNTPTIKYILMTALIQIHITYPNLTDAQSAGKILVENGLVACTQTTRINSIYEWGGNIESEQEVRLNLKTIHNNFDAIADWVNGTHPYDVPEITATEITHCSEPYANWVIQQCTKKPA